MKIEENYSHNKNDLLFSNDKITIEKREKILEKFNREYFENKKNESIKNLNLNYYKDFKYYFQNKKTLSSITNTDNVVYNLKIVNGMIENYKDEKIEIELIRPIIKTDNIIPKNDFGSDLNTLFTNSGFELTIKKNQKITLNIYNTVSDKKVTVFQKNYIKCEEGSEVTILDNYDNNLSLFQSVYQNIDLEKNSKIKHIITQKNEKNSNLFLTTVSNCKEYSIYNQTLFNFSEGLVINHHYTNLIQSDSSVFYNGVFFLKANNFNENKTYVRHKSEGCKSDQNYKGVLNDKSKGVYNSYTFVEKEAQKTEGYQLSKGILLSEDATFFSKPELRIFADDVKCSHGSTIGPIDDHMIYYIRSRGINKKEATKILIKSFIEENIEKINHFLVQKKIESFINNYLSSYN